LSTLLSSTTLCEHKCSFHLNSNFWVKVVGWWVHVQQAGLITSECRIFQAVCNFSMDHSKMRLEALCWLCSTHSNTIRPPSQINRHGTNSQRGGWGTWNIKKKLILLPLLECVTQKYSIHYLLKILVYFPLWCLFLHFKVSTENYLPVWFSKLREIQKLYTGLKASRQAGSVLRAKHSPDPHGFLIFIWVYKFHNIQINFYDK